MPVQTEMLYQLGSVLAGRHFALGRVIQFEGASDAERLLPLAAFEDVLLGRSLAPQPEVTVQPLGRNAVAVDLVNKSTHPSVVSRLSNWVEVDLAPAHAADVQLGGFDRYEVYDGSGRPVTPGRATRVRLYETLLAPRETVSTARIVVRGALAEGLLRLSAPHDRRGRPGDLAGLGHASAASDPDAPAVQEALVAGEASRKAYGGGGGGAAVVVGATSRRRR